MTEYLICPECNLPCFELRSVPAANEGVSVNEIVGLDARCADHRHAPCGRPLIRVAAVPRQRDCPASTAVPIVLATTDIRDAVTGEQLPPDALPAPTALTRAMQRARAKRKESP